MDQAAPPCRKSDGELNGQRVTAVQEASVDLCRSAITMGPARAMVELSLDAVGQRDDGRVAAGALDERGDGRGPSAHHEVALPTAGNLAVLDLGRARGGCVCRRSTATGEATRYDKTVAICLAGLHSAGVPLWSAR
ncbi:hypothetical protein GCM10009654_31290 [Streptomyces hebeiensis]|uniref:Uncharacterized protein n=1 Tax=Streptomyces hebeiensis TaxID=229486 RepID=A0ABP4FHH3_9ACTN